MRFKWFSGWWFQTFFMFHSIWDNPSHWLILFKLVKTTIQKTFLCSSSYFPSTWLIMEVSSNIRSWFYVRWGMDQNQHLFCFLMDIHSYFCTRIPENPDPNPTLNLGEHPQGTRIQQRAFGAADQSRFHSATRKLGKGGKHNKRQRFHQEQSS